MVGRMSNHCDRSLSQTRRSSRLSIGVAHSSPDESGWAQGAALFYLCNKTVTHGRMLLALFSCTYRTANCRHNQDSLGVRAQISQRGTRAAPSALNGHNVRYAAQLHRSLCIGARS